MKRNIAYMDPKDNVFIIFYLFQVLFRSSCSSINYQRMFLLRYPFSMSIEASNKKNMCECSECSSQLLISTTPTTRDSLGKQGLQTQPNWLAIRWTWVSTPQGVEQKDDKGNSRRQGVGWSDLELWNFEFILFNILQPMMNIHHISQI